MASVPLGTFAIGTGDGHKDALKSASFPTAKSHAFGRPTAASLDWAHATCQVLTKAASRDHLHLMDTSQGSWERGAKTPQFHGGEKEVRVHQAVGLGHSRSVERPHGSQDCCFESCLASSQTLAWEPQDEQGERRVQSNGECKVTTPQCQRHRRRKEEGPVQRARTGGRGTLEHGEGCPEVAFEPGVKVRRGAPGILRQGNRKHKEPEFMRPWSGMRSCQRRLGYKDVSGRGLRQDTDQEIALDCPSFSHF